jgi:hypothetical protein
LKSKIFVGIVALLLFSSMAYGDEPNVQKPSGAKLYIEETKFDFGYIPADAVVSHSFFFYSRGTDTLKILNVRPG